MGTVDDEELVSIGEAARLLGLKASALRYYEQRGLVTAVARRHGTRMYGPRELRHLTLIQLAQRLGMGLNDIAVFLHEPPGRWRGIVREQLAALEEQIRRAEAARDYLGHALQCPSDHPADECPNLRAILDRQLPVPRSLDEVAQAVRHEVHPGGGAGEDADHGEEPVHLAREPAVPDRDLGLQQPRGV